MSHEPPPATTGRRVAGNFPEPRSPWESRGLLYAEVVGALGILACVLATSMSPNAPPDLQAAQAKQVPQAAEARVASAEPSN